jgi:hypothetical protein
VLLFALGALSIMLLIVRSRSALLPISAVNSSQLPKSEASGSGPLATFGTGGKPATSSAISPTLVVTLIGPATPADAWANALLDRVLSRLKQPGRTGDGFAWWQGSQASGVLVFSDQSVLFDGRPFTVNDQTLINVLVVTQGDPNKLDQVGMIAVDQGALVLTVTGSQADQAGNRWILAANAPDTALQALVIQAAARSAGVRAAYSTSSGQGADLVLLGAPELGGAAATPTIPTAATSPSGTVIGLPTPTRPPEAALGTLVESKLNPVLEAGLAFPQDVVTAYTAAHAWSGPLTWRETGPELNNRPMNVSRASDLTFLILTPNDPRGPAQAFLRATFTGDVTRFPDEQVYFQGQRMNEMIYWLVYYSAQHGGQLQASYDDFGARQSITIVGFTAFSQPPQRFP